MVGVIMPKVSAESLLRVGLRHRGPKERDLDAGILWLRAQYKEEHGNLIGWEAYARKHGLVTPHRQEAIGKREGSSLDRRLGWREEG